MSAPSPRTGPATRAEVCAVACAEAWRGDGEILACRAAQAAGISSVFQELSLVPDLTVEENVWFRHEPMSAIGTVRRRALRRQTVELFERYGFPVTRPDQEVRRLTLAERQVVEVAKALARDPAVLILDEATSSLSPRETEWLLGLAGRLAADGKLVIYISHRLQEVRAVANRITVFRNGMTVAAHETSAVSDDEIISEMLGRRLDRLFPERKPTATDRLALRIRGLTAGHRLKNVDLDLREGEVLGVGGLQGHGQRELFQTLFGIGRAKGTIELWGKNVTVRGPQYALTGRDGIALVPEDRRGQGLLLAKSVRENLTLSVIPRFSRFGVLNPRREKALVDEMIGFLRIKAKTPDQPAGTLSGGNQQKVIFGKMLLTEARVLLLFDPTRGVRLVSFAIHWIKAEIHEYVLRNWRMVKVATTKAQRKLFFNLRSMKQGLGTMSEEDIGRMALQLKVKPEEVAEMERRLAGQEMTFEADEDDESYAPANYLAADSNAEPSRMLEAEETEHLRTTGLAKALDSLDARSRRIVETRWLREKDGLTLHDLAAEFKVSAERIRQIEVKALEKMKKSMSANN